MGGLSDYAYINSRIHALMAKLLAPDFFEKLLKSASFEEALYMFQSTDFNFIPKTYSRTGDLKIVEKELITFLYQDVIKLQKHSPAILIPLVKALSERSRYSAFKTALRLWFDQSFRKRSISDYTEYIPRDIPLEGVSYDSIINASNTESLTEHLRTTPYACVIQELEKISESGNLLRCEIILENSYYKYLYNTVISYSLSTCSTLFAKIHFYNNFANMQYSSSCLCNSLNLFHSDKNTDLKLILEQDIDMINLGRLVRLSNIVSPESQNILYIPGGNRIIESDFINDNRPSTAEILNRFSLSSMTDKLTKLEQHELHAYIKQSIQQKTINFYTRVKTRSLFDESLAFVYIRLRENEISRIISTLNTLHYTANIHGGN